MSKPPTAKAERNCALSHFDGARSGGGEGMGMGGMGRWLQVQPLTGAALSFCCRPLAVRSLPPSHANRTVCPLCRALQRFTCASLCLLFLLQFSELRLVRCCS